MNFVPHNSRRPAIWAIRVIVCLSLTSTFALGDAPAISHLFPAGMQRGPEVTVTCKGTFSWPLNVWAPGAKVTVADEKGKFTIAVPKDIAADRVWLRFYNDEGATSPIPFLIGSLPETQEVEPNNSPKTAQRLADVALPPNDAKVTVNGVLQEKGDVDSFAVQLAKGQTLVAAVEANTHFGSPIDSILQVVSPMGTVLAENHDDVGLDPRLAFTSGESGIYIVRLFAFPSAPNQRILFHGEENYVYRLKLTTGPYITHAVPMAVPSCEPDVTGANTVEVFGWNIPRGTRLPVVPLGESMEGRRPVSSFTSQTRRSESEYEANAIAAGTVSRLGLVSAPDWAGATRIRLVPHGVTSVVAEASKDRPLTLLAPNVVNGCIRRPNHTDCFRLPMQKGQLFVIAVESLSLDSPLVPLVQLKDPKGKIAAEVLETGAANDVSISHKATQDGDYLLTVRDRYRHGGDRYYYRLTVEPQAANFGLALEADSIVVTLGEPANVPITITRRPGSGPPINDIIVEAVDLPDGVFSSAVVSEPQGETASKVTLQLETEGVPFSGPIRIRGTAVERSLERPALTPAKFKASFDQVWLTVKNRAEG